MIPHPVKPATYKEEMRPLLPGNKLLMWNWAKWYVMPPKPKMTAPAGRPLKPPSFEQAIRMRPSMLSNVPVSHRHDVYAESMREV